MNNYVKGSKARRVAGRKASATKQSWSQEKRNAIAAKAVAARDNWTDEQKQQWRNKIRAHNLGIPVEALADYDKALLAKKVCPVCDAKFVPTGAQRRRMRTDAKYVPCCTVKCTNIRKEQNMTAEQRQQRSETRRRSVTAVHASRSKEQKAAIAKKAHVGRNYDNFRAAMKAIPKEARQEAAKKGHEARGKDACKRAWASKAPEELSRIFKARVATAKANGNYTATSKWEDEAYTLLVAKFTDVWRQHADARYPYPCDFYLPKYDTFIELHGFWVHGGEPYDATNPSHVRKVRYWRTKKQTMYNAAIKAWTVRDPAKVEAAKKNRLSLLRFYTLGELRAWLACLDRKVLKPTPLSDSWFTRLSKINAGRIVKHFQFAGFHRRELTAWRKLGNRVKVYANRQTWVGKQPWELSDQTILTGINLSGVASGYSSFDPKWMWDFIAQTKSTCVYDPCGGWGHRMLAAASASVDYIYNDVCLETAQGAAAIRDWLRNRSSSQIRVGCNDAADVSINSLRRLSPDAMFTCPPYHTAEWYSEGGAENLDKEQFDRWWRKVIRTLPKSVKHVGLVVPRLMLDTFTHGLTVLSVTEVSRTSVFRTDKQRSKEVLLIGNINFK